MTTEQFNKEIHEIKGSLIRAEIKTDYDDKIQDLRKDFLINKDQQEQVHRKTTEQLIKLEQKNNFKDKKIDLYAAQCNTNKENTQSEIVRVETTLQLHD